MIRIAIGIDPGIRAFGFGIIKRDAEQRWVAHHVETVRSLPSLSLHDRLARIFKAVDLKVVEALQECPLGEAIIACENQVGVQEGKRARGETNKDAVLVQQVVGMMRVIAFDCEQRFVEPSPAQAKAVLLGIRRTASKAQVQRAVRAMVKDCPKVMSEHASDALANALAGARMVN